MATLYIQANTFLLYLINVHRDSRFKYIKMQMGEPQCDFTIYKIQGKAFLKVIFLKSIK